MPEPLTATLISVTVVSVAVCVYKSIDKLVSAPKSLIQQTGRSTEDVIHTLSSELRKLFGSEPRISIHRKIIQRGGETIRELALYKETVLINEEWANTTWKSTKRLHVQQPFTLKAGFDLNRLKFDFDPDANVLHVTISESTMVNIEYTGEYEVLKEEHGLWNRITPAERDAILNSLPEKAREEAEKLNLREKAAEQLEMFLRRILPANLSLAIHCTDDTLCFQTGQALPAVPLSTLAALGLQEQRVEVPGIR